MKPIAITYEGSRSGERQEVVSTLENLRIRMQAIVDEYSADVGMPFGVDLVSDNGNRLTVALGREDAAISHYDASRDLSVTAVGNVHAQGSTMFYFGDQTLMPNKFVIPVAVAWRIIDEWCELGTLSSLVDWTSAIN